MRYDENTSQRPFTPLKALKTRPNLRWMWNLKKSCRDVTKLNIGVCHLEISDCFATVLGQWPSGRAPGWSGRGTGRAASGASHRGERIMPWEPWHDSTAIPLLVLLVLGSHDMLHVSGTPSSTTWRTQAKEVSMGRGQAWWVGSAWKMSCGATLISFCKSNKHKIFELTHGTEASSVKNSQLYFTMSQ